ncbi:hypothetical protein NI17_005200 [Thermobifida halotolerans]|uniref:DUF2567 domain-containing protein n=1 Tax=Thermobifida halotolerans TaxID=483545 RepID=A0AA97LYU6_9ACTN|nr:hypothetical protein [Thermobifida halotolerans]UOE20614.1 hypothetical protein NI17_005200 [Thermobifida halotolerans]
MSTDPPATGFASRPGDVVIAGLVGLVLCCGAFLLGGLTGYVFFTARFPVCAGPYGDLTPWYEDLCRGTTFVGTVLSSGSVPALAVGGCYAVLLWRARGEPQATAAARTASGLLALAVGLVLFASATFLGSELALRWEWGLGSSHRRELAWVSVDDLPAPSQPGQALLMPGLLPGLVFALTATAAYALVLYLARRVRT